VAVAGVCALGAMGMAGCGQKGPLFVPGVPLEAPWPYPPTAGQQGPPADAKAQTRAEPGASED